jgi:hypothetical protein
MEFAHTVVALADSVQAALRRLPAPSAKDPDRVFSIGQEHTSHARANVLLNDSARHTVESAGFSQFHLRNFMVSMDRRIDEYVSMAELLALSADLIMFVSAVSAAM